MRTACLVVLGHGESGDLSKRVEQEADILACAAKYLGMDR